MKVGEQIKAIAKGFEEIRRQIAEVESQINHPDRPASERRALKIRWKRLIKAQGLDIFFPEETKPVSQPRKKAQDYLSEALHQKSIAAKFKAAGDLRRAGAAIALSQKAEEKGKRLRAREQNSK